MGLLAIDSSGELELDRNHDKCDKFKKLVAG